jgi:hypothetical protein
MSVPTKAKGPKPLIERAFLVYQGPIANVFAVEALNLSDYGREAQRLMQSDFLSCENFARGLAAAGVIVRTAGCNQAGEIARAKWTEDLASLPFSDKFGPVNENNLTITQRIEIERSATGHAEAFNKRLAELQEGKGPRNNFVSVVVEGQLDVWVGPNPAKDYNSVKAACDRAQTLRDSGKNAYAVHIRQID